MEAFLPEAYSRRLLSNSSQNFLDDVPEVEQGQRQLEDQPPLLNLGGLPTAAKSFSVFSAEGTSREFLVILPTTVVH